MKSRLRVLLAEKEIREGRTISLREVVRAADVPISTVMGLANNTMREIPVEALGALCRYFDCEVGDLLRMEEVAA